MQSAFFVQRLCAKFAGSPPTIDDRLFKCRLNAISQATIVSFFNHSAVRVAITLSGEGLGESEWG
jgi:hypothetical protein